MYYNMPLATVIVWYVGMIDCHACNCLLKSCYGANIEIIRIRDKYFVIFFTIILIVKKRATQEETKRTLSMVGSMRLG